MRTASERRDLLKAVFDEARNCTRCPLHQTRTTVVFGAGNADADLMFIGEAPGANEDRMGLPFVGPGREAARQAAGRDLAGSQRRVHRQHAQVPPPDNRDPHPNEIEACQDYLRRQVDLIEPVVICTLGNFSTKLLRADTTGISRLHGREEVRSIGIRAVRLFPLYHPAAALYTPSTLEALRADFHRIPELLALGPPPQPAIEVPVPAIEESVPEIPQIDELIPEPALPAATQPPRASPNRCLSSACSEIVRRARPTR